jgi:AbrB family looped-hinge helix DNA binding protein
METVTVSSEFEVVIPKKAREVLGLQAGHKIQVVVYNDRIELIPVKPVRQVRGFLKEINTDIKREADRP